MNSVSEEDQMTADPGEEIIKRISSARGACRLLSQHLDVRVAGAAEGLLP
jgi:hypothetical protein